MKKNLFPILAFFWMNVLIAGGPLSTYNGQAVRYKSDTVKYHLDRGPFGIFTNQQARDLANASFKVWDDVASATVTFNHTDADTLPVDVNGTNYLQYTTLTSVKIDGINPIIFDSDGAITNALFGAGAANSVIGFAWTEDIDGDGFYDEGEAVMNGKFAMGNSSSFTYDEWKSTFVHEFGHFLGLDHSQINGEFVDDPARTIYIPTMYPTSTIDDVPLGELNPDDIAAISMLYPAPTFSAATGKISGSVVRANGSVVRGANVIAYGTGADSLMNRISTVTDYFEQNNGNFTILGLTPGSYYVRIEPIDPEFTEGSSVGPYSYDFTGLSFINPVIPEHYNGAGESGDPSVDNPADKTSVTANAGSTTAGIHFIANAASAPGSTLLTENFLFSGLLKSNGWSLHSGTTNAIATTTGLSYAGYPGSGIGNAAFINNLGGEDVNKPIESQSGTGTELFASLLVSVTDTATAKTGDYFFHLGNRASAASFTTFSSRLFARIVSGSVNFGIGNTTTARYGTENFSKNTTYLAVMKYTINGGGNDNAALWIFPSLVPSSELSAGAPLAVDSTTAGQDIINAVGLRQGSSTTSAAVVVDGITVTNSWPLGATTVSDRSGTALPAAMQLSQNYPNPFNPVTTISFSLPAGSERFATSLTIYDMLGREIATLLKNDLAAGNYSIRFDGTSLASGIYIYRLSNGTFSTSRRLALIK
jgi:hypothetical protein